ncbi:MAG TPA: DEAD/DEAH box helicase [Kineosporiaceae bacterium]
MLGVAAAVFIPDELPRRGRLALWGPQAGPDRVELVFAGGFYGVRKRMVSATLLPVADALDHLLTRHGVDGPDPGAVVPGRPDQSLACWAAAAVAGLGLIARGRLLPTITPGGHDAWRVGPLDPEDAAWLRQLGQAFPATGHALGVPGSRPQRLRSPESLVRDFWDAIADTLVRSPAAARTVSAPAFAATEPTGVEDLADWLATSPDPPSAGVQLGLRVEQLTPDPEPDPEPDDGPLEEPDLDPDPEPDDGPLEEVADERAPGPAFRIVLQARSVTDPTLIVEVADLWDHPERVLPAFGSQVEADVLLGLRRAAAVWPPLAPLLAQPRPVALALDDDTVTDLLGTISEDLAAAGVEVLWPAALLGDGLQLRAEMMPWEETEGAGFGLHQLLDFRWQLTLDGDVLDPDEIALLSEARRPLVRLRGRWVTVDPALLARLRREPARLTAAEALGAVLAGSIELDGDTVTLAASGPLAELADRLATLAGAPPPIGTPAGLEATLRPYQHRGVSWLAAMCEAGFGACLADDMGLGKTIQVIALHLHRRALGAGPTLVVCPASLLGTWAREAATFAPGVPVRRYHGDARSLDDLAPDELVLTTYGMVVRNAGDLARVPWGLTVADEAQHAKNPESRTATELRRLPAAARVALTGTPVENHLTDLWSLLDWTTPGLLGSLETFTRRIAVPVERYRDPDATARFARMVRPFLLRRRKTDPGIAPELPPKTETDRIVPLTAEQVTLYQAVVKETLAAIAARTGIERSGLVFSLLTALKQICNHPDQYLKHRGRLAGRSGKLAALDELTDVILASGESMLVFTQYRQLGELLQRHLDDRGVPSLFLHGGVPVAQRERMVRRFQAGQVPVFVLSLKAGGTGLTLTRATHVVHYDRWWNPAVEDQATDRAYRIGQDRPVQVHRLIAEGTLEDRIAALLTSKRELADAVVGSGEGWITELSDDELRELVTLRAVS